MIPKVHPSTPRNGFEIKKKKPTKLVREIPTAAAAPRDKKTGRR